MWTCELFFPGLIKFAEIKTVKLYDYLSINASTEADHKLDYLTFRLVDANGKTHEAGYSIYEDNHWSMDDSRRWGREPQEKAEVDAQYRCIVCTTALDEERGLALEKLGGDTLITCSDECTKSWQERHPPI